MIEEASGTNLETRTAWFRKPQPLAYLVECLKRHDLPIKEDSAFHNVFYFEGVGQMVADINETGVVKSLRLAIETYSDATSRRLTHLEKHLLAWGFDCSAFVSDNHKPFDPFDL